MSQGSTRSSGDQSKVVVKDAWAKRFGVERGKLSRSGMQLGTARVAPTTTSGEDSSAHSDRQERIKALIAQFKKVADVVGNSPHGLQLLDTAKQQLGVANTKLKEGNHSDVDTALKLAHDSLVRALSEHQMGGQAPKQSVTPEPVQGPGPEKVDLSTAFRAAKFKAGKTLRDAQALQPMRPSRVFMPLRRRFDLHIQAMDVAETNNDFDKALVALDEATALGRQLLLCNQVETTGPAKQQSRQKAQFDDLAGVLNVVYKGYFNSGMASGSARLKKEDLKAGSHFKAYLKALEGLETAKVNGGENPNRQQLAGMTRSADDVIDKAQAYLTHFANDLSKNDQKSKTSLRKKQICEESLKTARQFKLSLEFKEIGDPSVTNSWDDSAQIKATSLKARIAFETGYQKGSNLGSAGGQSAAYWVESNPDETDKKAKSFIFKPMQGEKSTIDSVKGAGAAKESLASSNAKLFERQTGIDLGVPESSVGTIGSHALDLPDGSGDAPLIGSLQTFEKADGSIETMKPGIVRKIAASECQRAALLDIMSLNVDRHSGNFLLKNGEGPNGSPKLIPIDHGCTLPNYENFLNVKDDIGGVKAGTTDPKNVLLMMPGSYEKFPQETIDRIALIDPDAIATGMNDHLAALDQANPGLGATQSVTPESAELSKRVLQFLKKAAATLSPAEIQIAIAQNAEIFADPTQDIEQLADQIIRAAAPKGPGYAEFFGLAAEQREKIARKLEANGWASIAECGEFIMSDPVTALKLYKGDVKKPQPDQANFDNLPNAPTVLTKKGNVDTSFAPSFERANKDMRRTQKALATVDQAKRGPLAAELQRLTNLQVASNDELTALRKATKTLDAAILAALAASGESTVDPMNMHIAHARETLADVQARLGETEAADRAGFNTRLATLNKIAPSDEKAAKDLERDANELFHDVTDSCLSALQREGDTVYRMNLDRFLETPTIQGQFSKSQFMETYEKMFQAEVCGIGNLEAGKRGLAELKRFVAALG